MKRIAGAGVLKSGWLPVVLGCVFGAVIFLVVFGFQVVVPTNVDWLLTGGDLSQHYIGWEFFRASDWTFPIGVAKNLAYPHGLAITFMDSLPIMAIPAKALAGILPAHFQYFGLWGLGSYMALGGFAGLIVRKWTKDLWVIIPFVLFICFSPIVFQRMFTHTALASHWIILAAVYAVVCAREWNTRKTVISWCFVLSLSVLIHPYFLAMNVFLLAIAATLRYRTLQKLLIEVGIPITAALFTTWIIGGFSFTTISGDKFGGAGYDLAAPFLPDGWSIIQAPVVTRFEMFAYLGGGGLLLVGATIVLLVRNRKKVGLFVKKHRNKATAFLVIYVITMIVAMGPNVKIAGVHILHYGVPGAVEKVWGVFRVTARLAWPLWYGVVIGALFVVLRFMPNKRLLRIFIVLVCVIQIIDIGGSAQLREKHEWFMNVSAAHFSTSLTDPLWDKVAKDRKHVVFLGDLYEGKFVDIAQFSLAHNLTLNTGYFARKPTHDIEMTITDAKARLLKGNSDDGTIYISDHPYAVAAGLSQREIDGYRVTVR